MAQQQQSNGSHFVSLITFNQRRDNFKQLMGTFFCYHWPLINFMFGNLGWDCHQKRSFGHRPSISFTPAPHSLMLASTKVATSVNNDADRWGELVLKQERRQQHQGPPDDLARSLLEWMFCIFIKLCEFIRSGILAQNRKNEWL